MSALPKPLHYIGGRWVSGDTAVEHVIETPADGTPDLIIPQASPRDGIAAVDAAHTALATWQARTVQQRAAALSRVADHLAARAGQLTLAIARETGMPLRLARHIQVDAPIAAWRYYAEHAARLMAARTIGHSRVEPVATGVAVCLTPWNYPLHQITAKVAPALLAGCTVVLKPSELAPSAAWWLAEALDAADLPPGVFNLVWGAGAEPAETLVKDPRVACISFTGSTRVGRHVAVLAAEGLKRVTLELGGKGAALVLPGADLERAVKATIGSCLLNSGQTCNAMTRMLVAASAKAQALELLRQLTGGYRMGDPLTDGTRLGPLASRAQQRSVQGYLERAREAGATVESLGQIAPSLESGFFVPPTVICDAPPDSEIVQEEVFGPVLVVQTYQDVDEAISLANGTRYGLSAAVWGPTDEAALAVAARLRAGQVDVNGAPFNPQAPFGGFGCSGIGRENGEFGLSAFVEYRSIQIKEAS